MFDEFAAALQFPWYFGGNWSAFEDCLRGLPGSMTDKYDAIVLLVKDAGSLLVDEGPDTLCIWIDILQDVAKRFSSYPGSKGVAHPSKALHVLLHCSVADQAEVESRFLAAGARLRGV
jgi:hypothetical protein